MLEIIYNTVAVIGFLLLLIFAWIGFKFVAKAFSFAAEMALLEWKYNKVRNTIDNDVAAHGFDKIQNEEKQSK